MSKSQVGYREENILNIGKKIDLGTKLTNEDILESHLQMIREKHVRDKNDKDKKLHEEKEALYRIQRDLDRQEALKMRSSDILKNEFLFFNYQKQLDNKLRRGHEKDVKASERYDHFPFTSGDVIDQHR